MKIGAIGIALLAVAGCGKSDDQKRYEPPKDLPLELKVTQAPTPPGDGTIELDVVTEPGATVYCVHPANSNGTTACSDVVADASGKAHLSGAWPGPSRTQVMVSGHLFGQAASKRGEVVIDVSNGEVFYLDTEGWGGKCIDHACHYKGSPGLLEFDSIEAGATLEVAGKAVAVGADGTAKVAFDDDQQLSQLPVARLANHDAGLSWWVPVQFTWKDGTSQKATIGMYGGEAILWKRLADVRKGGVKLPGDTDAKLGTAIAVVSTDPAADIFYRFFGEVRTMQDIGLVAVLAPKNKKKKSCGPYGNQSAKLAMTIADAEVTVYERATGKQRVRKSFSGGSHSCPDKIEVTSVQKDYSMMIAFELDEINDWLRAMAK